MSLFSISFDEAKHHLLLNGPGACDSDGNTLVLGNSPRMTDLLASVVVLVLFQSARALSPATT